MEPTPAALTPSAATPVGVWSATVERPGGAHPITLHFAADGAFRLVTEADASDGTWTPAGAGRFTFQVREPLPVTDESPGGWVDITQEAAQDGGTLRSSGISVVHAPDGTELARLPVHVHGSRTTAEPPQLTRRQEHDGSH